VWWWGWKGGESTDMIFGEHVFASLGLIEEHQVFQRKDLRSGKKRSSRPQNPL